MRRNPLSGSRPSPSCRTPASETGVRYMHGPDPAHLHPMAGFPQVCLIRNTVRNPNIVSACRRRSRLRDRRRQPRETDPPAVSRRDRAGTRTHRVVGLAGGQDFTAPARHHRCGYPGAESCGWAVRRDASGVSAALSLLREVWEVGLCRFLRGDNISNMKCFMV